jgi:pimeloyl-ACP methyl ester carboxylesterase
MATYRHLADTDLRRDVPMLDVPVYFILGRHELIARSTRAMDSFFTTLRAPAKRMVIFDQLGHAAHHEEGPSRGRDGTGRVAWANGPIKGGPEAP